MASRSVQGWECLRVPLEKVLNCAYCSFCSFAAMTKTRPVHSLFNVPQPRPNQGSTMTTPFIIVNTIRNWLQSHEEAQLMIASILVMGGLWWLLRTVIALFFSLICPAAVMLIIVMIVPQLRSTFLGEHYPKVAKFFRSLLLTLADQIKT